MLNSIILSLVMSQPAPVVESIQVDTKEAASRSVHIESEFYIEEILRRGKRFQTDLPEEILRRGKRFQTDLPEEILRRGKRFQADLPEEILRRGKR